MLPEFYETNLKRELGRAEYLLLKILINLLQSIKTVSIEALATALPIPIFFESRRKKIHCIFVIKLHKYWFFITCYAKNAYKIAQIPCWARKIAFNL
jgi:hypothetical protein